MNDFWEQLRVSVSEDRAGDVLRDARLSAALAILDLHKPNDRAYPGCVICSAADESCGCMGSGEDWPCATVIAVGRMFGVEYVPPPPPEPVEPDLDAMLAALDPHDTFGRALLDFERYPELTMSGPGFSGIWLTREQRIDAAGMRPVWQKVVQETGMVWDKLWRDFMESTPLPEGPSPLELAARTAQADQAVLDKARAGLDPDVARVAAGAVSHVGWVRPLDEGLSVSVDPAQYLDSNQVMMKITWRYRL